MAHFLSTSIPELMAMKASDLSEWHRDAIAVWNKLHPEPQK